MVLVADEEVAHHERLEAKTRGGCAALDTRAAAQVAARLLPRHGLVAAQNLVAVENGVDDAERRLARRPLRVRLRPPREVEPGQQALVRRAPGGLRERARTIKTRAAAA